MVNELSALSHLQDCPLAPPEVPLLPICRGEQCAAGSHGSIQVYHAFVLGGHHCLEELLRPRGLKERLSAIYKKLLDVTLLLRIGG